MYDPPPTHTHTLVLSRFLQCPCLEQHSAQKVPFSKLGQGLHKLSGSYRIVLLLLQTSAQPDHSVYSLGTRDTAEVKSILLKAAKTKTSVFRESCICRSSCNLSVIKSKHYKWNRHIKVIFGYTVLCTAHHNVLGSDTSLPSGFVIM